MIIAEICSIPSYSKKYFMRKEMYDELASKSDKFYFINCHTLVDKEKISNSKKIFSNKNIRLFHPKSYDELNKFLKTNNIFLINNLSPKFYHLRIHIMLKKKNIFQVYIDNLGEVSNYKLENWDSVNLKNKIYFLYLKKFSFLFYRILQNLRIINQIDILYIARNDLRKNYKKSTFLKFFLKPRFKKIKPVKPKIGFFNKVKLQEKFLVFIDANINHDDILMRGNKLNIKEKKKYLTLLEKYLINLKKLYKKKIIICLHPSSNINFYRKYIKGIKIIKFKTEFYLMKAFIVLFHESSSITGALLLKKKIINLSYAPLGSYMENRGKIYLKKFNLMSHDLHKSTSFNLDKKILLKKLINNTNNYNNYLKKVYFINNKYKDINQELRIEIDRYKKK